METGRRDRTAIDVHRDQQPGHRLRLDSDLHDFTETTPYTTPVGSVGPRVRRTSTLNLEDSPRPPDPPSTPGGYRRAKTPHRSVHCTVPRDWTRLPFTCAPEPNLGRARRWTPDTNHTKNGTRRGPRSPREDRKSCIRSGDRVPKVTEDRDVPGGHTGRRGTLETGDLREGTTLGRECGSRDPLTRKDRKTLKK